MLNQQNSASEKLAGGVIKNISEELEILKFQDAKGDYYCAVGTMWQSEYV